jgi:hypothetical protein
MIISTLDCPNLTVNRKSGNTTRQVNFAVEQFFNGHIVELRDHYCHGTHKNSNKLLFNLVLDRLRFEHNITINKRTAITVDLSSFTIKKI